MDFKDKILALKERILTNKEKTTTEEATKTAFILPMIQFLGYDIFNPSEVVPEFTADFGVKKGEKVDYAIIIDNNPIILIEAKHHNERLNIHGSQLFRYFSVTKSKFAILTNGIEYEFYTDIDNPNIMDSKPFFKFSITNVSDYEISELKKFKKENFNLDEIISLASELKYSSLINNILSKEFESPSDDFVRFFIQNSYDGRSTTKVIEQFRPILKKCLENYITNVLTKRLSITIETPTKNEIVEDSKNIENKNMIYTTFEEIEVYSIIKTIVSDIIDPKRIYYRDSITYFSVIIDDNNRKTICKLYLNGNKKYICFLDENKKEIKNPINEANDIFNFKAQLSDAIHRCVQV